MINYDNIPEELKNLNQWVNALNDSKVPICPYNYSPASSSDSYTWGTYDEARLTYDNKICEYCGFVFADNGYVGIDVDCGFDSDGFMTSLGSDIITACKSYTEKSRSGRGFHIILKGTLPFKGKNNLAGVEIYKSARYFIMTGDIINDRREIIENQEAIDYIVSKYFKDVRENGGEHGDRIYNPFWGSPITVKGKIRLHPVYPSIPEGARNICLASVAGGMHTEGYSAEVIKKELLRVNKEACTPPLDISEVIAICNSITKYRRD